MTYFLGDDPVGGWRQIYGSVFLVIITETAV
jgi:hypothetical protein